MKRTSQIFVFLSLFLLPCLISSSVEFSPTPPLRVALTFDDGPRPTSTLQLKDVLDRYHVPATFFVVGHMAARYPDIVRALADDGHEISNHTWNHFNIRLLSPEAFRTELDRTRVLIEKITGQHTFYFRTPGATERYVRHRFRVPPGYELVLWDVHSLDQEGGSPEQIAHRVLRQVKDGNIVLMHNGLHSTMEALDIIIPALKKRGFEFVTISTLLKDRPHSNLYARYRSIIKSMPVPSQHHGNHGARRHPVSIRGDIWTR